MELLTSKKFKIPDAIFITDRNEISEIPKGTPYLWGDEEDKEYFIRLLEYEVLYRRCMQSGLPFNWKKILEDNGYTPEYVEDGHPLYFDYNESEEGFEECEEDELEPLDFTGEVFKRYMNDCTAIIDMQKIRDLNLFPVMLEVLDDAILTNIHNFLLWNPHMYSKKLDYVSGGFELTAPARNLIICDVSSTMTKGIATSTLLMSKSHGESFYADILVTGARTILYPYEILHTLDVDRVYEECGQSNEGDMFKALVMQPRKYGNAIVYGDNDHPGGYSTRKISDEDGKKLCKWEINKLISFHKDSNIELAGYSRWFSPKETEKISDWCKYLNKE